MNILQINASDSSNGGASRVVMSLMDKLHEREVNVSMFSGTYISKRSDVQKIKKGFISKILSQLFANDSSFFFTDYLLRTEEFKKANIIHAHNLHGWYFNLNTLKKMSCKKKVVWTLHDMWAVTAHCAHSFDCETNGDFYRCPSLKVYPKLLWHNEDFLQRLKSKVYKEAEIILVVPSLWLKSKIEKSVLKDKVIHLIYNGVDTDVFVPFEKKQSRNNMGLPEDKKIILFVASGGINNYFKGGHYVRELAKQFESRDDVVFVCVGGSEDCVINNVIFRKSTSSKDELVMFYGAADLLIFTSLAENFPLVVLEAMSCGLPVVSFDVGGVKESVVHELTGYIAQYKNLEDLNNGIIYIFNMIDSEYIKMQNNCRERVIKNFSLENMIDQYVNLYKSLT